ncbi:MAG TPA: endolytic transglycosylase MltG [Sporichthyaceae bacterium]|nr:endolytic transglycosylase MltG [Sporichthyaceae bacterium]
MSDHPTGTTTRPDPGRSGPPRRRSRKAPFAVVAALLAVLALAVGATVGFSRIIHHFARSSADYSDPVGAAVTVKITSGESLSAMGQQLEKAGVVESVGAFVSAANAANGATKIPPGTFRLAAHMPAKEAVARLLNPTYQVLWHVVVPEGRTTAEIVATLSSVTGITAAQFNAVLTQPAGYGLPTWDANPKGHQSEGFLFPATYDFQPGSSPTSMLTAMTKRFGQAVSDTSLLTTSVPGNLTPFQILTVASLAQAEAKRVEDMPKIARVIYNRLAKGMMLQLDTTVLYANGGIRSITTTPAQRAVSSPYNTYQVKGLPPGPIDSPGEDAIKAALAPADGSWLYFVAVNPQTGETRFEDTAAEHAADTQLFQQWLAAHPNSS